MKAALSTDLHNTIAQQLYEAEKSRVCIPKLAETYPDINIVDSYKIQQIGLEKKLKEGHRIVGRKIGLTSKGMLEQLGADQPDYSYLLDYMMVPEGTPADTENLISPRIEGEIAFIMNEDLEGPGVTPADVQNATAWVVPCFEVCDCRYTDWKVSVRDTIADMAGASRFMIGSGATRIDEVNLRNIGMIVEKNGELAGTGAGAEVMGSPLNSMAWLVNKLAEFDTGLKKGDIVLSGAFIKAFPAESGDIFTLEVDGFPSLSMKFR